MSPSQIKSFQTQLLCWFAKEQRSLPWRKSSNPYFILVSEVMLQQTQVKTVIPYYQNFIDRFPTLNALAVSELDDVLKVWEGMGYYARARNLHKAAKIICLEYDSIVPKDYDAFLKLPGVGEYTAAAVQSIAFGKPVSAVDGNIKRVLSRIFQMNQPINLPSAKKGFAKSAESLLDKKNPGDYNQAMMELGALVCKPLKPNCEMCPVSPFCLALESGSTDQYPKRQKKKALPEYQVAVGVIIKQQQILITQRKLNGLLGGLWEFPGGKLNQKESAKQACIREIIEETSLKIKIEQSLTTIKQVYTHFKIVMEVFICRHVSGNVQLNGPINHRWIGFDQISEFSFPKANHKIFPKLEKYLQKQAFY